MALHYCAPERDFTPRSGGSPGRYPTVDFHCHVLTTAAEALVADRPQKRDEPALLLKTVGAASVAHNNSVMLPKAFPKLTQLNERLADMDSMGVDMQVLSPSPTQYYYWADPELAQELVRAQNEHIAELCGRHPDRFVGLGTFALQHPKLAPEQLRDAMKRLGLKGAEISTTVNGAELDAPELEPFWSAANELGAVIFIHPFGTTLGNRVGSHYLVGATTVTTCGAEAKADARERPIQYLRKIWFDTLVYEPEALRHLVEVVGASQLVVGSDYPFDMGHYDPHALLAATPGLSEAGIAAILGENARAILGLSTHQLSR